MWTTIAKSALGRLLKKRPVDNEEPSPNIAEGRINPGNIIRTTPILKGSMREAFPPMETLAQVRERARADGTQNLPLSHETGLGEFEQSVVDNINTGDHILELEADYEIATAHATALANALEPVHLALELNRAHAEVGQVKLNEREKVERVELSAKAAERELRAFKDQHNLAREARYDPKISKFLWAMLLALAAESAFNAMVMLDAGGGLIGGAFIAGGISAVNILIGLIGGGAGMRLTRHLETGEKRRGRIILWSMCGVALLWNIVVAIVRSHFEAAGAVDQDLQSAPTTLLLQSLLLFLVGVAVAFGAGVKAQGGPFSPVDYYWGFAEVARKAVAARQEVEAAREDYRAAVDAAYAEVENKIAGLAARDRFRLDQARDGLTAAERRVLELDASRKEWREAGLANIREYRERSSRIRTTPPPVSFRTPPVLPPLIHETPNLERVRALIAEIETQYRGNLDDFAQLQAEVAGHRETETRVFLEEMDEVERRMEAKAQAMNPVAERLAAQRQAEEAVR